SAFLIQADDGIRIKLVTGVQTCALPIYAAEVALLKLPSASFVAVIEQVALGPVAVTTCSLPLTIEHAFELLPTVNVIAPVPEPRSEERRVGEGSRGREEGAVVESAAW